MSDETLTSHIGTRQNGIENRISLGKDEARRSPCDKAAGRPTEVARRTSEFRSPVIPLSGLRFAREPGFPRWLSCFFVARSSLRSPTAPPQGASLTEHRPLDAAGSIFDKGEVIWPPGVSR